MTDVSETPEEPQKISFQPLTAGGRNWLIGVTTVFATTIVLSGHSLLVDLPISSRWIVVAGMLVAFSLLGAAIAGLVHAARPTAGLGFGTFAVALAVAWLAPSAAPAPMMRTAKVVTREGLDVCGDVMGVQQGFLSITMKIRVLSTDEPMVRNSSGRTTVIDVPMWLPTSAVVSITKVKNCD